MKFVLAAVLCLCLAGLGHAELPPLPALPAPLDAQVLSVVDEMAQLGENTAKTLVHQYEEIIVEPHEQLTEAVDQIDARREETPQCVAAKDEEIDSILDMAHEDMHVCGVVAAHESAEIATDVSEASQQLAFGAYSLGRTYQTCQRHKNSIRRQTCMASFYMKGTIFLVHARVSIKTLKNSVNVRIPAVFTDSNSCTHVAADKAVFALGVVNDDIDVCANRAKNVAARLLRPEQH